MYLSEIMKIIGKDCIVDRKINEIKIDSRTLNKDDVFVCINSGYKYISDAIKKEVALIITEKSINNDTNIPIVVVKDTKKVLGNIAKYIRGMYNGTVIAITGSNGKTTTKELLSFILREKYKVLKNNGSENNHIGVPNTLLQLNNSYDYVVLELGTNHPGEIKYLTDIVKPNIAIVTNIGLSHIGNFKSIENIFKEKLCIKKDNTILFVNGDDKYLNRLNCNKVYSNTYNFNCGIKYLNIDYYLAFNVCEYLEMNIDSIIDRAKDFKMEKSRMNIFKINSIVLIDDTYNASYESVIAGLSILNGKRNIIILGDMLELGDYNEILHMKVYNSIKNVRNNYLITFGNNTKIMESKKHFYEINDLIKYIKSFRFKKGDVIYVKGAHKNNLYTIVSVIKDSLQNI